MNRQDEQGNWAEVLEQHSHRCESVCQDWDELVQQLGKGHDIEQQLRQFKDQLHRIKKEADRLDEILRVDPMRKAFSLNRFNLGETEYHLLRAAGVELFSAKGLGVAEISDYEAYQQCVYEDENSVSFMDPNETPDTTTMINEAAGHKRIRIRVARSPEECRPACLRPGQRAFWAKYRPDVLARMQPEQSPDVGDGDRRDHCAARDDQQPVDGQR